MFAGLQLNFAAPPRHISSMSTSFQTSHKTQNRVIYVSLTKSFMISVSTMSYECVNILAEEMQYFSFIFESSATAKVPPEP